MFGSIDFVLVPSRHHMVAKDGKPARPKYHVYFPVSAINDAEIYKKIKALLQKAYPFFDANALDAARFLFGVTVDKSEIVWKGENEPQNLTVPYGAFGHFGYDEYLYPSWL